MEFQQRLYELRKQSGLSQEGLASLLGVTRQAVQKWESGSSRPDMDNLAALARYFNVSLDYLVTGEERSAPPPAATIINNYYSRWHYEYKSPQTFFGLPLIHIRLGERGLCTARGIIAIGNCAVGVLAIGGFSFGLVSVGGLSLGLLFSLGGMGGGRPRCRRARPGSAGLRRGGGRFLLPGRLCLRGIRGRGRGCRLKNRHWRRGLRPSGHRADGGGIPHLWPGL